MDKSEENKVYHYPIHHLPLNQIGCHVSPTILVSNIVKYLLPHTLALETQNDLRQTWTHDRFLEAPFTPILLQIFF